MFWVILFSCVGEILAIWLTKKLTGDQGAGRLAGGCFSLLIGAFMYQAAKIQMVVVDGYTWEGRLTSHEKWYYFLLYFGLFMLLMGVIECMYAFYNRITDIQRSSVDD